MKIAATGKNNWIEKLEEFSLDPACTAKMRDKINAQIERIRTLQIGEKAPNIITQNFNLHQYKSEINSLLLLFYSPSCFHCTELLVDLIPYSEKVKLRVIAIQVDEEMNPWTFPAHWKTIKANEKVRKEYGVFSTPSLFLILRNNMRISAIPENMSEIKKSEHLF
jgi:thioredoxin-related protein